MIRAVIDANVLVSAAISMGPSHRILSAAMAVEGVSAVVCAALLAEVDDVMSRPRLRKRVCEDAAVSYLDDLVMLLDFVDDPASVPAVTRDPKDDYLVALAREQEVDFIVTGDKDLR